jgi:arylsulfate sulfotransferase
VGDKKIDQELCRVSQEYRATLVSGQRALRLTGTHRRSIRTFGALRSAPRAAMATAAMALAACGGNGDSATQSTALLQAQTTQLSQAASSSVQVTDSQPGVTPFISFLELIGRGMQNVTAAEFTIEPKSGSVSKPVHVRYAINALVQRGYLLRLDWAGQWLVRLPVFGLYAGYANQVLVRLEFQDGSVADLSAGIATAAYQDPNGIYDHPTIFKKRDAGTALGFDFFVMKSGLGSPVVVDTDGEIRWVGAGISNAEATVVEGDGFVIGDASAATLYQLRLDGSLSQNTLPAPLYTNFHHNIDHGKEGQLAEVNTVDGGTVDVESDLVELTPAGSIVRRWDLAAILSAYMRDRGDDPSAFVRPGADWFHMNAATYDPRDDSVIVSSRENFLVKLDYSTGNIAWILGDPTKYWYTFPSLRAKALTLQPGNLYPIGQHAVSITSDGLVMIFNDGAASQNQPAGAPAGQTLNYSAVSAYSIDSAAGTAQEVWRFDNGQSISARFCSSAYEASGASLLVDYATAAADTEARLVGVDAAHNVVFDFEYETQACNTSWNATPIAFDDFSIM